MIAAAMTSNNQLFSWFDVALVLILGFGFWRGRKHGMTKEFIPFFRWMFIIIGAGFGYPVLGKLLIQSGMVRSVVKNEVSEVTAAYIISYLFITALVWVVFVYIGRLIKSKLEGSNIFGGGEYYLGIIAGILRYACITVFGLALLHAPYYTPEQIAAKEAYNNRWYGGGMKEFKGDFIPSVDEVQVAVFNKSLFGPFIGNGLALVLITTVPSVAAKPPVVDIQQ